MSASHSADVYSRAIVPSGALVVAPHTWTHIKTSPGHASEQPLPIRLVSHLFRPSCTGPDCSRCRQRLGGWLTTRRVRENVTGGWSHGCSLGARVRGTGCGPGRRAPGRTVRQLRSAHRTSSRSPTRLAPAVTRLRVVRRVLGHIRAGRWWVGTSTADDDMIHIGLIGQW